jgi:ligand-binding sensor domain-containing protein
MPSSPIHSVFVDRYGFVWFASDSGVHRYDGQNVYTIDRDPEQRDTLDSRTNAAVAQTSDAMWILGFAGVLQRLDSASGKIETFALEHNGELVGRGTRLVADRTEKLWIGTELGLFRFDPLTRQADFVDLGDSEQPRVVALALSEDGAKLFACRLDGRLVQLDIDSPLHIDTLTSMGPAVLLTIAPTKQSLWLGTHQGLFHYDFATRTLDQAGVPAELTRGRIDATVITNDGALWVGGAHHLGLTRVDANTGQSVVYRHRPDDPYSLASDHVSALAIDGRGNLWVGLQREGAARLRIAHHGATRYRASDAQDNSFCAEREMPDGRMAVILCGASVAVLDPRNGIIEDHAADIDSVLPFAQPTLTSHAIVADGHGGYWLPTDNTGLLNWRPDQHAIRRYPLISADGGALPDPYMNDAALDASGRLWVACSLGLATLAPGKSQLRLLDVPSPSGKLLAAGVLSVSNASDGKLWLGTTQGLFHFDTANQRIQRYANEANNSSSLSDNMVVTTHIDMRGSLWIGTQAGLNHASIEGGTLRMRRYSLADGLPDQTIDAIAHDTQGTLWIGTNRGIARFDAEHDRFVALGPDDGVPATAINWQAGLTGSDGSIYFGGASGLLRIFPQQLHIAEPQPLMLSSYEVGSASQINLRGLDVKPFTTDYTQARVRLNFTAFGDHRPMSYRLAGLETSWQNMPANLSVSYGPLPFGDYRFEVRQARETFASLTIPLTVSPPPWRTPLAYLLYIASSVATLLLAGFIYRQRRARELQHLEELQNLERQALDARLRLLQAQVAPHFLFNTLANVRALVKAGSPRAEALLRNLIDYLRAAIPRLNERATTLGEELQQVQAYLALMRTRIPDRLQFTLHADASTYALSCPPLTLLTLVENAVRHGIDPCVDGGRIDIEVHRRNDRCIMRVNDTGVGLHDSKDAIGTGLSALRERLQLFFRGDAELRLSALSPHGTSAEIEIPARTES